MLQPALELVSFVLPSEVHRIPTTYHTRHSQIVHPSLNHQCYTVFYLPRSVLSSCKVGGDERSSCLQCAFMLSRIVFRSRRRGGTQLHLRYIFGDKRLRSHRSAVCCGHCSSYGVGTRSGPDGASSSSVYFPTPNRLMRHVLSLLQPKRLSDVVAIGSWCSCFALNAHRHFDVRQTHFDVTAANLAPAVIVTCSMI